MPSGPVSVAEEAFERKNVDFIVDQDADDICSAEPCRCCSTSFLNLLFG